MPEGMSGAAAAAPDTVENPDVEMDEVRNSAQDSEDTPRKPRNAKRPIVMSPSSEKEARPAQRPRLINVQVCHSQVYSGACNANLYSRTFVDHARGLAFRHVSPRQIILRPACAICARSWGSPVPLLQSGQHPMWGSCRIPRRRGDHLQLVSIHIYPYILH